MKSWGLLLMLQKCCDTDNKPFNNNTNRVIYFVKEGNISKISSENRYRFLLPNSCMNWYNVTDL